MEAPFELNKTPVIMDKISFTKEEVAWLHWLLLHEDSFSALILWAGETMFMGPRESLNLGRELVTEPQ
jgi:hypothetical protein